MQISMQTMTFNVLQKKMASNDVMSLIVL
jgi:hypothetical protein